MRIVLKAYGRTVIAKHMQPVIKKGYRDGLTAMGVLANDRKEGDKIENLARARAVEIQASTPMMVAQVGLFIARSFWTSVFNLTRLPRHQPVRPILNCFKNQVFYVHQYRTCGINSPWTYSPSPFKMMACDVRNWSLLAKRFGYCELKGGSPRRHSPMKPS